MMRRSVDLRWLLSFVRGDRGLDLNAVHEAAVIIVDVNAHTDQLAIPAQVLNIRRQQTGVHILLLDLTALQPVVALILADHVQDVCVHILPGLSALDTDQRLDTYNTEFHK